VISCSSYKTRPSECLPSIHPPTNLPWLATKAEGPGQMATIPSFQRRVLNASARSVSRSLCSLERAQCLPTLDRRQRAREKRSEGLNPGQAMEVDVRNLSEPLERQLKESLDRWRGSGTFGWYTGSNYRESFHHRSFYRGRCCARLFQRSRDVFC
jgi:hypothetical protein